MLDLLTCGVLGRTTPTIRGTQKEKLRVVRKLSIKAEQILV